jgi:hypothetical protein
MALWDELNVKVCARCSVFGVYLTASITLEVKNNPAHVAMHRILNKFTKNKICCRMYGLAGMLSVTTQTIIRNIDKILS